MQELPAHIPHEPPRAYLDRQGCWQGCGCGCIPVLALAAGLTVAAIAGVFRGGADKTGIDNESVVAVEGDFEDSAALGKTRP